VQNPSNSSLFPLLPLGYNNTRDVAKATASFR
jgi:hypothetical protein